jgi:hypothetical protein
MIIPPSVLRMRNVSDKWAEEMKPHILCSKTFKKIVPFMR